MNWDKRLRRLRGSFKAALLVSLCAAIGIFIESCSSAPAPLSLRLYNPETNQTLFCNADDPLARSDRKVLAGAVEGCARQLEARGFVREK